MIGYKLMWCNAAIAQRHKSAKMQDTKVQRCKGIKVQRCNTALYNSLVPHNGMALLNGVVQLNGVDIFIVR